MTDQERKAKNAYERERRRLHRLHRYEDQARERGHVYIGGIDEVGRGPLAGPVVAACVITAGPMMLKGLNDSKVVRPALRLELSEIIKSTCIAWAVGVASVQEINRINIYWASVLAMERALAGIGRLPDYLLTDAVRIKSYPGEQLPVIKGDAKCATVAAASIVAKVYRDDLLTELGRAEPRYGFAEHKGYATPAHIAALKEHGPCVHHRTGFWRVRDAQLVLDLAAVEQVD
ncbi:MAG: ribonuclease HII [Candidatus Eremiobacteraeota bacterium]|nr:ribonuclease HII [Candidatus Eremiobacteraeota bacterium]